MNKTTKSNKVNLLVILITIAILALLGVFLYTTLTKKQKGIYTSYTSTIMKDRSNTDLVYFFSKNDELSSTVIDANLTAAKSIPENLTLVKVGMDNVELVNKYKITYPNTFIRVDKNGNELKRNTAIGTMEDIVRLF
jgi:hypothetical protein